MTVLVLAAGCTSPRAASAAGPASAGEYGALEWELFQRVSLHRDSMDLPRLRWNDDLAAIAREHSRAMAAGTVPFGHDNFQQRVARAASVGYVNVGENVAFNDYPRDTTAMVAVAGLVNSPPHRNTMEGSWEHSGVGVARSPAGTWFYTQLFARRPSTPPRRTGANIPNGR